MTTTEQLRPFEQVGYALFPLKRGASTPRDKGWQTRDYFEFDPADWIGRDGRVGVLLAPGDLVIDIDPRNGGAKSFERLCANVGCRLDGLGAPMVQSGGGGLHIYLKKPSALRTRVQHRDYPGVDFKKFGGYVVAAGSLHDSGRCYRLLTNPPLHLIDAPQALLDLIEKPPVPPRTDTDGGIISCEKLVELLAVLNPEDFGRGGKYHDEWLPIAMACHDATDGYGLAEWLEWNAGDAQYGDEADEMNRLRWESFDVGGGVTYRTLFKAVAQVGRKDLLRGIHPGFDTDAALRAFMEDVDV